MTLGFMQHWPKEMAMQDDKTYFIEKINLGLLQQDLIKQIDYVDYLDEYRTKFHGNWDCKPYLSPKLHTIRKDENDRWNAGKDIHFVVNGRTKDRFQFAPVVKCVSVQEIFISNLRDADSINRVFVQINGRFLNHNEIKTLAQNDGFESVEDFFKYFNQDFHGKLIHFTNLKY